MIQLREAKHAIHKEPLLSPFGFKGAYLSELWQSIVRLESEDGRQGQGVGVQSVLWSDASIFVRDGEQVGNEHMADITRHALNLIKETKFHHPIQLIDDLYPEVHQYGRSKTKQTDLRGTFSLNALVGLDQALWSVYANKNQASFEESVPKDFQAALGKRQDFLASIPLIPYGMSKEDIEQTLAEGYFLLKIKVGADPEQDGDQEKMLTWDCERLTEIHQLASRYHTEFTDNGKIAFYLDANGRYESKETLQRFLDHADKIGALEQIVLFEEPFPEEKEFDVNDIPVRLAADESVHDEQDALQRIEMGYKALALKPVAKTMSLSLKFAKLAKDKGVPCFCADLTANPILVDWNKNLAARLDPLPGLKVGVIETNGYSNYRNWELMKSYHPRSGADWIEANNGLYHLSDAFYQCDGGALELSQAYEIKEEQS